MDHSGHEGMDHSGHEGMDDSDPVDKEANEATDASASASASDSMAGMDHGGMSHEGMSPFLFARKTGFFVLFEKAFVTNTGGFIGALFATFAFGVFTTIGFEFGKRIESRARAAKVEGGAKALPGLLLGALAHGFRLLLHYIAMLLVMTMNVWIIVAVLLGHMVGFLAVTLFHKGPRGKGKLSDADSEVGACDC